MKANRAEYSIAMMCAVLKVSTSGYYSWLHRNPSERDRENARLCARIAEIHEDSDGTYGSPRIHAELTLGDGEAVNIKRVARLMSKMGLRGVCRRRYVVTTRRDEEARSAPDLVERDFTASKPDDLWVSDITAIPTWEGFVYLAMVLDVYSRKVVGWSMASHMRTELVLDALQMAIDSRGPEEVIHHSDQGSQYTSIAFGSRCQRHGVTLSMGSVGDCYDNAMSESFFATLECELLDRTRLETRRDARAQVFAFIEGWYNTRRRHSSIGYVSPAEYERRYWRSEMSAALSPSTNELSKAER